MVEPADDRTRCSYGTSSRRSKESAMINGPKSHSENCYLKDEPTVKVLRLTASSKILTSGCIGMTSRTCCIPKCESHRKHARLYEMSTRNDRRKKWIMAILSNCPDMNTKELEKLKSSKWLYVCHKHFERKFFNRTMRLRNGCFPTLFTEREIATGVPKVDPKTIIQEATRISTIDHMYYTIKKIHIDHTYSKKNEDEDAWMDHVFFPTKSGKAHTLFEPKIKRGEVHSDHSYALRNLPTDTANADGAASTDVQSALQEDEPAFEEDNDQMESDSRLPKDEVMIDYIIEHPVSPGRDIFETIEPEDKKKDTIFSWEKTELLETDDPEDEPVLVPETKIPEDLPTLSLFCDEPEKPPVEIAPSKPEAAVVPMDVVYRCVDCAVVVDGFTFWCVQCLCGVLCGACAEISPHNIHYVLRAPRGATLSQTQPVLLVIREQLQKENLLTLYGTDVDCVKVEVKLEPEEPLSVCEDPLACAPRAAAPGRRHAEPEPEDVDSHSEAGQSSVENVEPQPAVQISLEGAEPHSEAVQFYLDGVEPHPEAVQFYLEAVERGSDAVLLEVETTSPGTEELHHEAAGPDNEARELQHDVRAEKRVNMETVSHHHPLKRHRLMTIRPGDNPTSPKVSDVQHQALKRIPPTIISQTVLRLPDAIPSNRTGPKIQPRDPRKSETLSKCTPTELVVPQNVHKGPNILRRSKTNKVEIRKSTLLKHDMPKSSSLMTQQINPRGFPLQVSQNIKGFSGLKVTSGPRRYENSDDGDVEFLDEEILDTNYSDNEIDRLRKENQNEYRIDEEFVGDIESELGNDDLEDSRIDRLDKENRDGNISDESEKDDEESDKNSSKDKESEIDDDDLDEDFRIDEQDRTDEDSMDEKNSAEGVCRRTRHATNATVRNQRKRVQKLTSEAVVRLQRLTSLDIRNWTNRSKSRRKD